MYQRKEWQIRLGGVNLVAPGDKIEETEALDVTNFRVDRYGALRSRKGSGSSQLLTVTSITGPVHTAVKLAGRRYYAYPVGGVDHLRRNTALVDSGLTTSTYVGMAAYGNWVWIANPGTNKMLRDDGTNTFRWNLGAQGSTPIVANNPTPGNLLGGYKYRVTLGTAGALGQEDFEGNPSNLAANAATNEQMDISNISAGPTGTGCRHIYRYGGTIFEWYRVHTIYDNVTTTWTDNIADADLANQVGVLGTAIILETDNDAPPAANGVVSYLNRLVVFRDPAKPRRVYYSKPFQPHAFPGAANGSEGNWFDVDDDIIQITAKPRQLFIYTKTSIWRLAGDIDENPAERSRSDYGLVSTRAVVSGGLMDYFFSKEGLCSFNGDFAELVSRKLDPIFHDDVAWIARASIQHNPFDADAADLATAAMAFRSGRLWLSVLDTTGVRQTWIYEIATERWVRDSRRLYGWLDEGHGGELIACYHQLANGSDHVGGYNVEDAATDSLGGAGTNYDAFFHSCYSDMGYPENEKIYEDLVIDADTGGLNMTVKVFTNQGEVSGDAYNIGTINTATRQQVVFRLNTSTGPGIRGKNIAVRLEVTNTGQTIIVYRALIHYFVEPRHAKSFDTDENDLGVQGVKEIERIELDIFATAAVTWKVWTELPGNAMASRDTNTIALNSTRTKVSLQIAAGVEGRLMRFTLESSGTFQLYGPIRVKYRVFGEYRNGAATPAEKFMTPELLPK